jgi:hypothetical protein
MSGRDWPQGGTQERLERAIAALREATAEALRLGSWFAPTLDDCRGDAERLLGLGTSGPPAEAVLARAELVVRTWDKLKGMTGSGPKLATVVEPPCPQCRVGSLQPVARAGRKVPFRGVELAIPDDFVIPTCDHCGAEELDPASAARLDEHLWLAWSRRDG